MKLREALAGKLSKKELEHVGTSFDVIGDIAILELPYEVQKKAKVIGKTVLRLFKNVKVVAIKVGEHKGKYRRQKMKVIAGENRLETTHKESGVLLRLDVEKCYYSPRLGSERLRIARQIRKGERILVAGSGVGPYPLVLAKHSPAKEIVGVELNPVAHKYALENVRLNKLQGKVKLVRGDAAKIKLGLFDRIIIAMPTEGVAFVPKLWKYAKKGAVMHILDFAPEDDLKLPTRKLVDLCKTKKRPCKIMRIVKAGTPAVRRYRVCIDARI